MSEQQQFRAIALSAGLTARETIGGQILLYVPSDEQEGYRSPPNEIYLTRDMARTLAEWADPPESTP